MVKINEKNHDMSKPCSAGFYWATNKYGTTVPVQVYQDTYGDLWFCWVGSQSPISVSDSDFTWSGRIFPPENYGNEEPRSIQIRDEIDEKREIELDKSKARMKLLWNALLTQAINVTGGDANETNIIMEKWIKEEEDRLRS